MSIGIGDVDVRDGGAMQGDKDVEGRRCTEAEYNGVSEITVGDVTTVV